MAAPDISSKKLMQHNDVFADIFDALVFGEHLINPENLHDIVPESSYEDSEGNLRSMERDLFKRYGESTEEKYLAIAELGIGNQAGIDPTAPVRVMGYDYTAYKRQLDTYNNKKRALLQLLREAEREENASKVQMIKDGLEKLGSFKLTPVITIVLNFSKTRWNKATSLKGLIEVEDSRFVDQMPDYPTKVYDVLYLDEATKAKFTSDFRDIVTVLSEGIIDKSHDFQRLKYPTDVLDMLYAYTKDEHYLGIRNWVLRKEEMGEMVDMSGFFNEMERNNTIKNAKILYNGGVDAEKIIFMIENSLKISPEEAKEIFDKEILGLAVV